MSPSGGLFVHPLCTQAVTFAKTLILVVGIPHLIPSVSCEPCNFVMHSYPELLRLFAIPVLNRQNIDPMLGSLHDPFTTGILVNVACSFTVNICARKIELSKFVRWDISGQLHTILVTKPYRKLSKPWIKSLISLDCRYCRNLVHHKRGHILSSNQSTS